MSKICIVGGGGSGKDYLKKLFESRGFIREVSYTTRPMRDNEQEGVDYHYVTEEKFSSMVDAGKFLQHKSFRGWRYGTTVEGWNKASLFIMTPEGVVDLSAELRATCTIIYLDIDENIRRKRLSERNDADDTERRLNADREQFKDFKDYDIRITNPDF